MTNLHSENKIVLNGEAISNLEKLKLKVEELGKRVDNADAFIQGFRGTPKEKITKKQKEESDKLREEYLFLHNLYKSTYKAVYHSAIISYLIQHTKNEFEQLFPNGIQKILMPSQITKLTEIYERFKEMSDNEKKGDYGNESTGKSDETENAG
jgi:hypothetical protein